MSVAAVSAACLRRLPDNAASICTIVVLPLADAPTRMDIHPLCTQCATASRASNWPGINEYCDSAASNILVSPHAMRASPMHNSFPLTKTRRSAAGCGAYPNASSNNCPHRARSSYVRRRCKNKVPNRRSTATAGASVVDLSARSHQRKMSLKLNSQGEPARANVSPGAFAACASDALNRTIADTLSSGIPGCNALEM